MFWLLYLVVVALMIEGALILYSPINRKGHIMHAQPKAPSRPVPKVTAAALAGALTVVGVWVAGLFDVAVPGEVAAGITTLLSFVAGWFTP